MFVFAHNHIKANESHFHIYLVATTVFTSTLYVEDKCFLVITQKMVKIMSWATFEQRQIAELSLHYANFENAIGLPKITLSCYTYYLPLTVLLIFKVFCMDVIFYDALLKFPYKLIDFKLQIIILVVSDATKHLATSKRTAQNHSPSRFTHNILCLFSVFCSKSSKYKKTYLFILNHTLPLTPLLSVSRPLWWLLCTH